MIDGRRLPPAIALALIATLVLPVFGASPAAASESVLVIDGKGWGHGVGMAQDGALAMGRSGADTSTILQQFYPGTTLAQRAGGTLRVPVLNSGGRTEVLVFPDGGEIRASESGPQPAGFPVAVPPGGSAEISFDGVQYRARLQAGQAASGEIELPMRLINTTATTTPANKTRASWLATSTTTPSGNTPAPPPAPGSPTPLPPSGTPAPSVGTPAPAPAPSGPSPGAPSPVPGAPTPAPAGVPAPAPSDAAAAAGTIWAVPSPGGATLVPARNRRYRGEMEVTASGPAGNLRLVNRVDVEEYLRGMGEVRDPSWPAPSLQTQAIAARTYALRAVQAGGEICDYDRCQVYIGQTVEYPEMDKAVADTRGQVLEFNGGLATTVYSANAGGTTATPREAWGGGATGEPYLRSAPYPTSDPMPWSVEIGFADLGARFGYPGTVTGARVSNVGPSGRAIEVTLSGDAGDKAVDGLTFMSKLSMRSNLFSFRTAQVEAVPPPPPEGNALLQELPGGNRPLLEAPTVPLPQSVARVAVTLPPADRMGLSGLAGVVLLLLGFGVYARYESRRAARRGLFNWSSSTLADSS